MFTLTSRCGETLVQSKTAGRNAKNKITTLVTTPLFFHFLCDARRQGEDECAAS